MDYDSISQAMDGMFAMFFFLFLIIIIIIILVWITGIATESVFFNCPSEIYFVFLALEYMQ
jgi:hypothetical protein